MAEAAPSRRMTRCIPVQPARRGTTITGRSPGSRIIAPPHLPGILVTRRQWPIGTELPGHSCGDSAGIEPASLLGPASRTTRDVAGRILRCCRLCKHGRASTCPRNRFVYRLRLQGGGVSLRDGDHGADAPDR
ncbi:hypothetical protein NSU_0910 [Novosphingobium pentaromativorans US6-1]|uniref:Uncharacterized protein n=1 Tax=Novosphingobium pentaromativorans US6-1 TaxID=1088721 RepID=G6E989_9SPHN|nr:hypothetical protein NSU_0910 [Novosphingobium pentaromativorans US6-1]